MHELGIVLSIIKQMEDYMKEHNLTKIEKLVLQIGQLSEVYPKYLEDVYPIAVKDTLMNDTELVIEITPGIGRCESCDMVYNLVENDNTCPLCANKTYSVIRGTEFLIKEIHAY